MNGSSISSTAKSIDSQMMNWELKKNSLDANNDFPSEVVNTSIIFAHKICNMHVSHPHSQCRDAFEWEGNLGNL